MENNLNVEIVERDPKSFAFHPSNPRDHSDESVARLAESIQEDPLYFRGRPILLSDRTGELVVIGGEGRTRAAILLGLDSVPSVVFHGLTEEDEIRIMQKDNSHSGKWNDAKLSELAKTWGSAKMKAWSPDVTWHETFKPNLSPVDGAHIITDSDIIKAQKSIDDSFKPSEQTLLDIECPYCGEKFTIKV